MIMGGIVTPEQLRDVAVMVRGMQGSIAKLVDVKRVLARRYPEDAEVAKMCAEFSELLCDANKAMVEVNLLSQGAPVREPGMSGARRVEVLRPPVVGYGMLAAHDDSVIEAETQDRRT